MRAMRVIGLLGVRFQPHAFAVVCRALLVLLAMSMTTMRRWLIANQTDDGKINDNYDDEGEENDCE